MREIFDHKSGLTNDPSDAVKVLALDEPGPGNACHQYVVRTPCRVKGLSDDYSDVVAHVDFQNGPLQENVLSGASNESVLAVVIDRLKGFQAGPFACRENAVALTKLQEAMHWLHTRTRDRQFRGVEGKTAA